MGIKSTVSTKLLRQNAESQSNNQTFEKFIRNFEETETQQCLFGHEAKPEPSISQARRQSGPV